MRGLVILAMILTSAQSFSANDFPEQQASIPVMRTGHSVLIDHNHLIQAASRRLVLSRFSATLNRATPQEQERILGHFENETNNPALRAEIVNASVVDEDALVEEINHSVAQIIRNRFPLSLRATPEDFILASGFTKTFQDQLTEAGCYIRLGQYLKSRESSRYLASSAFLKAGLLFATIAPDKKSDDSLLSAAQCYYWAFRNESVPEKKQSFKKLSILQYVNYLLFHSQTE
ncbi:MAG: hypothetical protein ACK4V2_04065 [Pseudomonadota bacterium]|jgi:hypothetical protein|nr:hypothetical protein [Alphaproteobacteria bacterium]